MLWRPSICENEVIAPELRRISLGGTSKPVADLRTIHYNCKKTDGNGSASPYLTPLFQAWAESKGLAIVPGTLNLCAHRDIVCPAEFISLRPWEVALTLEWRKRTVGYDPRLYFVALENKQPAWLFRWSADERYPELCWRHARLCGQTTL